MHNTTHDKPSDVSAENGQVVVDGPDGVAVSLTPPAALETSDRLHKAAVTAAAQGRIAASDANARAAHEKAKTTG
jgi:hypothetical protein